MSEEDWDRERHEALTAYPEAKHDIFSEFMVKENRIRSAGSWGKADGGVRLYSIVPFRECRLQGSDGWVLQSCCH